MIYRGLFIVVLFTISCTPETKVMKLEMPTKKADKEVKATKKVNEPEKQTTVAPHKSNYVVKIVPNADGTFGYDIYNQNQLYIHQPNIPSRPGNAGFGSPEQAELIAKRMIEKLEKNILPPSIDEEDLKKAGVN